MKEKKYFCDYWRKWVLDSGIIGIVVPFLCLIIGTAVIGFISYTVIIANHVDELNSYTESTYQYLEEIANDIIQEEVGVDVSAIPDDIKRYELARENDEIILKLYADNNKGKRYATSSSMTIKMSEEFGIISKEPDFSSREDYESSVKSFMKIDALVIGVVHSGIGVVLAIIGCCIASKISRVRKNRAISIITAHYKFVRDNHTGTMNMNDSTQKNKSLSVLRSNKAIATKKSYPVNRDVISTLPRSGGKDYLRPSVLYRKNRL